MDSKYLQQQRFLLQKRFRRMNSASYVYFHSAMIHLWEYLHKQPLLQGILYRLSVESPAFTEELNTLNQGNIPRFEKEAEHLAFIYRVVENCCAKPLDSTLGPEIKIGHRLSNGKTHDDAVEQFREHFLDPLYEQLDEALDGQQAVLSLLLKYKQKVEWFEREELAVKAKADERALAKHLYAFLFDQGLDFHIEPHSASGEADLVARELVLDAKVFDGSSRGVTYLAKGVHQLYTYAQDFNQTVGYLVVYKTCPETLHFAVPSADDLVPHIVAAGKTIYLLTVDICEHEASASKRGVMKTYSVGEGVLARAATEAATSADASGAAADACEGSRALMPPAPSAPMQN